MPKIVLDKDYFNYCEDIYATFEDIPEGTPLTFGIQNVFTVSGATVQRRVHLFHVETWIPSGVHTLWIRVEGYETVYFTISIGLPPPPQPVFIVDNVELPIPPEATHVFVGNFWLAPFAQLSAWLLEQVKNIFNAFSSQLGAIALSAHAVGSKLIVFLKETSPIAPAIAGIIIAALFAIGVIVGGYYIATIEKEKTRRAEIELQKIQEVTQTQQQLLETAKEQYEKGNLTEEQYQQIVKTILQTPTVTTPPETTNILTFLQNFLPAMLGVMLATIVIDVFKTMRLRR